MAADMTTRGFEAPQLRAEIVASALLGINLARALGWFPEMRAVPKEELVGLITDLLDADPNSRS
jgi:hypothetical protein